MERTEIGTMELSERAEMERLENLGRWLAALLAEPSMRAACAPVEEHGAMDEEEHEPEDEEITGGMPRPIVQPYHHF